MFVELEPSIIIALGCTRSLFAPPPGESPPRWCSLPSSTPDSHWGCREFISPSNLIHDSNNTPTFSVRIIRFSSTTRPRSLISPPNAFVRREAMTSQQPPSVSSKAAVNLSKSSSSQLSPAASQTQQFFSHDLGQRRASSGTKHAPAARNQQSSKPKHKSGKRFLRVLDDDDEQFAMQNPHGRRGQQNITHLMNFSLPPRPNAQHSHRHHHGAPRRAGRVNNTWSSGYHAVDKAR